MFQKDSLKIEYPEGINDVWKELIKKILIFEEEKRPNFKELKNMFDKI